MSAPLAIAAFFLKTVLVLALIVIAVLVSIMCIGLQNDANDGHGWPL